MYYICILGYWFNKDMLFFFHCCCSDCFLWTHTRTHARTHALTHARTRKAIKQTETNTHLKIVISVIIYYSLNFFAFGVRRIIDLLCIVLLFPRRLRGLLIDLACRHGDPGCLANATAKFRQWLDSGVVWVWCVQACGWRWRGRSYPYGGKGGGGGRGRVLNIRVFMHICLL